LSLEDEDAAPTKPVAFVDETLSFLDAGLVTA
jgi:hypothetical protein